MVAAGPAARSPSPPGLRAARGSWPSCPRTRLEFLSALSADLGGDARAGASGEPGDSTAGSSYIANASRAAGRPLPTRTSTRPARIHCLAWGRRRAPTGRIVPGQQGQACPSTSYPGTNSCAQLVRYETAGTTFRSPNQPRRTPTLYAARPPFVEAQLEVLDEERVRADGLAPVAELEPQREGRGVPGWGRRPGTSQEQLDLAVRT